MSDDKIVDQIKNTLDIQPHTNEEGKTALNEAIVYLLHKERFYGNLILNMRRIFGKQVPTAGVNITDQINLYINPDFFCSMTLKQQVAILKHECAHVMNAHMARGQDINVSPKLHQTWNVACDLAINGTLPELKKIGGMFVDDFNEYFRKEEADYKEALKKDSTLPKKTFPTLQERDASEVYYQQIREYQKENPEKCQGMQSIDDHGIWEEGQQNVEVAKEMIKNTMKKAVEQSGGIGNVPGDVSLALNELNKASVNWKKQLRQFFARSLQFDYTQTRKKRNRRTGLLNPGKRKKPNLNIVFAADTSGSMSDAALKQVFSEIKEVYNSGAKVTVIEADSQIHQVYEFDPKKDIEIKGRGGTAYQPVFDYVNKNLPDVDALIFAGDMDAFDTPLKPKYPVLWAVNGGQNPPGDFGTVVRVEVEGE